MRLPNSLCRLDWFILGCALLAGCGTQSAPLALQPVGSIAQPLWQNGGFENDSVGDTPPVDWTVTTYLNGAVSGTASAPPTSLSALNLTSQGNGIIETYAVGGATGSQIDPDLGSGQSFRYPIFGQVAARVNYENIANDGNNKNVNVLQQTQTIGLADVDPSDGQVHVRFAIAPILEVPAHTFNQQPYYYVQLVNITRGTTLYTAFNVAGQSGVPWTTTTSLITGNAVEWLNWQLVDIAPGSTGVAMGDQVQLSVIGAGCSKGGHFGRIYIDGVGSTVPGVYASATAPVSAAANSNITYTMNYANGGTSSATGAHVDMTLPTNTTFISTSLGALCTNPNVGAAGTLSCPVGTLAAGASGSFTVIVHIASGATGSIVNGNYSIGAVNAPTLLGSPVTTTIPGSGTNIDLVVTQTASVTSANPNQAFPIGGAPLYTITVTNNSTTTQVKGSNDATFTDTMPAQLTNVTWDCNVTNAGSASGTASRCDDSNHNTTAASGTGNISIKPRLGYNGGKITIHVHGTINASSGTLTNTAATTAAVGVTDPDMTNNSATVSIPIGTLKSLTVTKTGSVSSGNITSAPSGITCSGASSCASATGNFVQNSNVLLTASPVSGGTFVGWSGGCSGTATTCQLTLNSNTTVTAAFNAAPTPGLPAQIYIYSGDSQQASTSTAFSRLVALVTDANGIALSGVTVSYGVPSSGASATLTPAGGTATTNASGLASIAASANATPGSYQVSATANSLPAVQFNLTNVGPPASVTYISGGDVTDPQITPINTAFGAPLLVVVEDAAGNPVPGATVNYASVAAGGASATLSGSSAITGSNGQASVTATANGTAGSYTATATVSGASSPVTFQLQNALAGAAAIYAISGGGQTAALSTAFAQSLVAVVADAGGNSLPNKTVTFTVVPATGGASAAFSNNHNTIAATTGSNGEASVTVTANGIGGSYQVNATVTGVSQPATFSLVNDGGDLLAVQAGSPQSTAVGTPYGAGLQILLADPNGSAVSGAVITFTAPNSGASVSFTSGTACGSGCATVTTDGGGGATVHASANTVSGSFDILASTPNAPQSATFGLTNLAGAANVIVPHTGTPQGTPVGGSFAPLVAFVSDSYGNPGKRCHGYLHSPI